MIVDSAVIVIQPALPSNLKVAETVKEEEDAEDEGFTGVESLS
jgi:hypothetical protein